MTLGFLVASENANRHTDRHTDRQDSCFISIDMMALYCVCTFCQIIIPRWPGPPRVTSHTTCDVRCTSGLNITTTYNWLMRRLSGSPLRGDNRVLMTSQTSESGGIQMSKYNALRYLNSQKNVISQGNGFLKKNIYCCLLLLLSNKTTVTTTNCNGN